MQNVRLTLQAKVLSSALHFLQKNCYILELVRSQQHLVHYLSLFHFQLQKNSICHNSYRLNVERKFYLDLPVIKAGYTDSVRSHELLVNILSALCSLLLHGI